MSDTLTVIEHQEIIVNEKRNVEKNTISYEDKKLLFSIIHKDRFGKEKYVFSRKGKNGVKANSIVGSISLKNGLIVEILPKFAKNDLTKESIKKYRRTLLNIIRVSNERNFISSTTQSSKVSSGEMPLIRYMIELFSESLLVSLRSKSCSSYNKTIENSSYIKGNILVQKTIQKNIIDQSKVYISYNKHSSNNLLMKIFKTLGKSLLNDTNLSYKAKQNLYEVYLLLKNVDIINLKHHDFHKITFNRLNSDFEILFRQAEFIFNQYIPFSSNINSTPFWAVLFDMTYLFEKFCSYLFRKSNIEIEEQNKIDCFYNKKRTVKIKPDFILYKNNKVVDVADAKWKILDENKTLYGLNAQNFWQLFSYMNLTTKKEINGYFIVPKNNSAIDDNIVFNNIEGNHKDITILSIDFSLNFEDILENYKFEINNNKLSFSKIKNKNEILSIIKKELLIIKKKEKKYLQNLNQKSFVKQYKGLSKLLMQMGNNFKTDKFFLKDLVNLSKKNFNNMFDDISSKDGIDINIFVEYIEKDPNSKYSKSERRYNSHQPWNKLGRKRH